MILTSLWKMDLKGCLPQIEISSLIVLLERKGGEIGLLFRLCLTYGKRSAWCGQCIEKHSMLRQISRNPQLATTLQSLRGPLLMLEQPERSHDLSNRTKLKIFKKCAQTLLRLMQIEIVPEL